MKEIISKILNKTFRKVIYYKEVANSYIKIEKRFSLREGIYYAVSTSNFTSNYRPLRKALLIALESHVYKAIKYESRYRDIIDSLLQTKKPTDWAEVMKK
jgi:hypothetical protein